MIYLEDLQLLNIYIYYLNYNFKHKVLTWGLNSQEQSYFVFREEKRMDVDLQIKTCPKSFYIKNMVIHCY